MVLLLCFCLMVSAQYCWYRKEHIFIIVLLLFHRNSILFFFFNVQHNLNTFNGDLGQNKEKWTRAGVEPATSGLTYRRSKASNSSTALLTIRFLWSLIWGAITKKVQPAIREIINPSICMILSSIWEPQVVLVLKGTRCLGLDELVYKNRL